MKPFPSIPCRVCGDRTDYCFDLKVLRKYQVDFFECASCGYLQTEQPHWLNEAYQSAINDVDTGILYRNALNARRVVMTLAAYGLLQGQVIDYAGGYGILVRLLRDLGVDAYWEDKYCSNLHARGFEAAPQTYQLLTAFEVFEHLEYPVKELSEMLERSPLVLLSTETLDNMARPDPNWWYLGSEHGQHIGFFRHRTFTKMAKMLNCHHAHDGNSLHLLSHKPIPASWKLLQSFRRYAPKLAHWKLNSRTTTDYELLRRRLNDEAR